MLKYGVMLFCLICAACSPLKPVQTIEIQKHILEASVTQKIYCKNNKYANKTLLVNVPTASPGYDTKKMIYTKQPYELKEFAFNQWVAPPAKMIQPVIVDALSQSGLFKSVVGSPFSGKPDYMLAVQLLTLQQEFTPESSQVNFSMRVELIDRNTRKIIKSRVFTVSQMAVANNPHAGVVAANEALATALSLLTSGQNFCI